MILGNNLRQYLQDVVSWEVVVRQYNEAYELARHACLQLEPVALPAEL